MSYLSFGVLNVFIIDKTFSYRIRRPKIIYPLSAGLGVLFAAVSTRFYELYGSPEKLPLMGFADSYTEFFLMLFIVIINALIFFFLKEKWWKKLFLVVIVSDLIQNFNTMFSTASYIVAGELFSSISGNVPVLILIHAGFYLFEFLFCFIIGKIGEKKKSKPFPLLLLLLIDILVGLIGQIATDGIYYSEIISKNEIAIVMMLLGLSTVVVFMYISNVNRERQDLRELNQNNEEYINSQTKHFEKRAAADKEVRAMRHDMRNNIQVLMLLLEKGEYDKMRDYLEEMGEGLAVSDVSLHTGSAIADAIISEKISEAASKGIKLTCSGMITGVEFTPVDTCKMLANILDNAVEACEAEEIKDLPEKLIELNFKKTDNHFMICCSNPTAHFVDLSEDGITSTKKDKKNHGFGIHNIKTAAGNYGGELMSECKKTSAGYEFSLEIIFPLE